MSVTVASARLLRLRLVQELATVRMDISQYTSQGLVRPSGAYGGGTNATAGGTKIRAFAPEPGSPSASNPQTGGQTAQEYGVFDTLIDTVNPLQHLPGVSSAYQLATGDDSSPLADMAGGFLFGGPVGLMAGAAKSFLEMVTGKSLTEHAAALLSGSDTDQDNADGVQVADTVQRDPVLSAQANAGLSLQQYQDFAKAAESRHQGIGASTHEVSWADTMWTQRALKQATGLYENSQNLGDESQRRARLI